MGIKKRTQPSGVLTAKVAKVAGIISHLPEHKAESWQQEKLDLLRVAIMRFDVLIAEQQQTNKHLEELLRTLAEITKGD